MGWLTGMTEKELLSMIEDRLEEIIEIKNELALRKNYERGLKNDFR
jgi:hypothetical protein